jgi:type I restriction enzyme M protein
MLDKDIKQRINTARQILVGKVPDPKAQVEQITTALIYKFMDDMDRDNEELGGQAQFLTAELREYAWGRLMSRELSGMERWNVYTRALDAFSKSEQIPELFRTIFKGAYLPYRDPETLNLFLKEINAFSYDNSENLGNAYEYLLSILGSQGDAGQFRTPRHIIDFIVEVVNPQKSDRILDPACGTAGFLISSYKHLLRVNSSNFDPENYVPAFARTSSPDSFSTEIQQNGKYDGMNLTPDDRKRIAKNMQGYDISPDMVRLSLVNLYLHNFPAPRIVEYDTLTYEDRWDEQFDVILANPPFMTPKGGIRPHKRFRVSANRAEVLFVDYIAEHLSLSGRAGVIVPEGIIFQTATAYKALRKMLVEDNYLYAVVSLPAGVFQPYAGVKTSVLFLDRELAKRNKEILFVRVENDGFDLGAQRRRIEKNDLGEAFQIIRDWQEGKQPDSILALTVPKNKVAENGEYNLTGDRYREAVDYSNVKWPMVELGEIAEIARGGSPRPIQKYITDAKNGINWIKIGDVKEGDKYIFHTKHKIISDGVSKTRLVKEGDFILSNSMSFGRPYIVKIDGAIHDGWLLIRVNDEKQIIKDYLYHILGSEIIKNQYKMLATGGVVNNLNSTLVRGIKIPLPPLEVQQALVAELDGYQKIIDGYKKQIEQYEQKIKDKVKEVWGE